jgi:mevalonate kinase
MTTATAPLLTAESVCASAPGKVILFGEHAVVYGHPAIAASLSDLRIACVLTPTDDGRLHCLLPDLPQPVNYTMDCRALEAMPTWPLPPTPHETAAAIVQAMPADESATALDELSKTALAPILYLCRILLTSAQLQRGWQVYVQSADLPVGAGLGSSAAFSVALAAALLRVSSRESHTPGHASFFLSRSQLDKINHYAYLAEILLHGTPSGLDNAVATYGGALRFTKPVAEDGAIDLQPLAHFDTLSLLLVHTHVPRSTKALVAHVRAYYTAHPTVVAPILQAMGAIAEAFSQQKGSDYALLDWVRLNHALLRAVGVSHPRLEALVQRVDAATDGAAAAKLTGAGGGGCALVVWQTEAARQAVVAALQQDTSYSTFSSTVGGPGVQWHADPAAVLRRTTDQERFLCRQSQKKAILRIMATTAVAAVGLVTVRFLRKR